MPPPFSIPTNSPAPSDLISAYPANEQANRLEIEDWLFWLSDDVTGIIKTQALPDVVVQFASGTKVLFAQTAAPTGWTKDVVHDNKALRLVSGTVGTGGAKTFTDVFAANYSTDSFTLLATHMPGHTHTFSGTTGSENASHQHGFSGSTSASGDHVHNQIYMIESAGGAAGEGGTGQTYSNTATGGGGNHAHTFSGTTGSQNANHQHAYSGTTSSTGGGTGHAHTVDLDIAYVDVIIATKD